MTKIEILAEIKRTAEENGGIALGQKSFAQQTGIPKREWLGVYWRSWGDAVRDAGLTANKLTAKIEDDVYLSLYSLLALELGRLPTKEDLQLKKRTDPSYPWESAFHRRFGSYTALRARAQKFCATKPEFADVMPLFEAMKAGRSRASEPLSGASAIGYVYMVKHGTRAEYKIGMTRNTLRREGEIRLELPESLHSVHYIATDDPSGVEAYWHNRFAAKRKKGEWFALTRDDVAAFKRWKKIS